MKLKSYSVKNYRSFENETEIELRPLTLFFGYNSSGKSALLRALPLMAASHGVSSASPLNLETPLTRDGSWESLLCRLNDTPSLELGLEWKDPRPTETARRVQFLLRELRSERRQVMESLTLETFVDDQALVLALDLESLGRSVSDYVPKLGGEVLPQRPIAFNGLTPFTEDLDRKDTVASRLKALQLGLRDLSRKVHWLEALRKAPERRTTFKSRRQRLGSDGEGVIDALITDQLDDGGVLGQISEWFRRSTGFTLSLPEGAGRLDDELFSLTISPTSNPSVRIPLVDTGEGMSQVLPVLVLAAMAKLGKLGEAPILALEHPELHLHPKAHGEIARIFCEVAGRHDTSLLVETHSESLLRRVQLAIAEEEIDPRDVLVYWIRQEPSGRSLAERIEFDALAVPQGSGLPPQVFSEAAELARKLAVKRRALRTS